MNSRLLVFLSLVALVAVSVVSVPSSFAGDAPENKPGKGDSAPGFSVPDIDGKKVVLEDILKSGKVVLLNFWGLRCSSCIEEIGYLNPLVEKYAGKGIVFLGVNVDGAKADMIKKQMPAMANQPRFTVLPDPAFEIPDKFNLTGAPLSFIIGKDGIIQYRHEDFKPGDQVHLEEAIKKALAGS